MIMSFFLLCIGACIGSVVAVLAIALGEVAEAFDCMDYPAELDETGFEAGEVRASGEEEGCRYGGQGY